MERHDLALERHEEREGVLGYAGDVLAGRVAQRDAPLLAGGEGDVVYACAHADYGAEGGAVLRYGVVGEVHGGCDGDGGGG